MLIISLYSVILQEFSKISRKMLLVIFLNPYLLLIICEKGVQKYNLNMVLPIFGTGAQHYQEYFFNFGSKYV